MEIIFAGEKYISIDDVTKMLNMKEYKIYALMDKGELPRPLKPDPRAFWKRSEIEAYIESTRK